MVILEGDTLGDRHKYYNHLLKQYLAAHQGERPGDICYDDSDIDNFLKIDVACHNRDVDYIFRILKCKDLLYVTRAIKRSTWLITDDKYAEIINPKYLHTELFPYMMTKAKTKFVLQIRLHLKDETRVQSFYLYYKTINLALALKWLPRCPLYFAYDEVNTHAYDIQPSLLKRLCRRDPHFLDIIIRPIIDYRKEYHLQATMFLLKRHSEFYMGVLNSLAYYYIPTFSKKALEKVMKTCPDELFNKFMLYIDKIDHPTFFKYTTKETIKELLIDWVKSKEWRDWEVREKPQREILRNFLQQMGGNCKDRMDILKVYFEDQIKGIDSESENQCNLLFSAYENASIHSARAYYWYQCMPFDVSFQEVTKLIRIEKKPKSRHSMLSTLVVCAGRNPEHTHTLLQYYHENHINEMLKFKIKFITYFLSCTEAYKFNIEMWAIINNLFCSMELYMNSNLNVNVQKCIETIILYKVIHNDNIPEIIESKFEFNTFGPYQNKLNLEEKNKLFIYLYNHLIKNIETQIICSLSDFRRGLKYVENTLKLLADWDKNIMDFPYVLNKISELAKINNTKSWHVNLSTLYNIHKPWRKIMFKESFDLCPSEKVLINALKHNIHMFTLHSKVIDTIRSDDAASLKNLLRKLRIYWPNSLAEDWKSVYLRYLKDIRPHRNVVRSLATLMSQKEIVNIVTRAAPDNKKIDWKETNELEYSLRKNIALNIHIVRPLVTSELILWFAKGDYLQYAVPSLNATLSHASHLDKEEYVFMLLDVPVSLQKHGIRMAFAQLNIEKFTLTFEKIWKSTQNSSLRTILFINTHKLLRKETNQSMIENLWELLSVFIDNLSDNESNYIYKKLTRINEVPSTIRADYCMKAYLFLITLPDKRAEEYTLNIVSYYSREIIEFLDEEFIECVILQSNREFTSNHETLVFLLAIYLLNSDDEEMQLAKYNRLVKPLFDNPNIHESENFQSFLWLISSHMKWYLSNDKVIPVAIFKDLLDYFEETLSYREDYVTLTAWKLKYAYLDLYDTHRPEKNVSLKKFGEICLQQLKADVKTHFPSIYLSFKSSLENVFSSLGISIYTQLLIFKHMLEDQSILENYFLVHDMIPDLIFGKENILKSEIIEILCSHPSTEFKMHCLYYYPNVMKQNRKPSTPKSTCVLV